MILSHLGNTVVGTVNLAEVHGKLMSRGVPEKDAWEGARSLAAEVVDFGRQGLLSFWEWFLRLRSIPLTKRGRA